MAKRNDGRWLGLDRGRWRQRHVTAGSRDAGYPAPPAQIRTCPIKASGSYLGCLAANRTLGHG
jgi:hypothetical protein